TRGRRAGRVIAAPGWARRLFQRSTPMTNAENSTIEPTAEAVVADASAPATERAPDAGVTETAATQTDAAEDAKTETASEANGSDSSAPAQDVAATEGE